jgi:hypothetical protein
LLKSGVEALVAIDGSVDFSGRKNEPILFGIRRTTDLRLCGFFREVLQAFHFNELEGCECFLHDGFALRSAGGPERLQQGEVLHRTVEPLP